MASIPGQQRSALLEYSLKTDMVALMENPVIASEASLKKEMRTDKAALIATTHISKSRVKVVAYLETGEFTIFPSTNIPGFSRRGLK